MGRMARTIRALIPLALLVLSAPAFPGETGGRGGASGRMSPGPGRKAYTLGEVRILGSAEHPGVLFFLPRARFRLLPYRPEIDWKKRIQMDDRILAGE
ncbi:MAG: hypothetical protein Kow00128_04300 [Deltaproteobacteria bacterium]